MLFEAFVGAFDQHGVGFLEERSRSFGGLQHFVEREVEIPRLTVAVADKADGRLMRSVKRFDSASMLSSRSARSVEIDDFIRSNPRTSATPSSKEIVRGLDKVGALLIVTNPESKSRSINSSGV